MEIPLPWIIVQHIKHIMFREAKSEDGVRDLIAFLAHDVVNSYLRVILPNISSILYREPQEFR